MKKVVVILLICIFASGCTLDYNLEINEKTINENFTLSIFDIYNLEENDINGIDVAPPVFYGENEVYTLTTTRKSDAIINKYSYTYDINDYGRAYVFDLCYPDSEVTNENGVFRISTKGSFSCAVSELSEDITSAKINITTKLKVISNNADKVSGNTYTWIINESNYLNKPINIEIKIPSDKTALVSQTKNTFIMILLLDLIYTDKS